MPFPYDSEEALVEQARTDMEAALVRVSEAQGLALTSAAIRRSVREPHGMLNQICVMFGAAFERHFVGFLLSDPDDSTSNR